MRLLSSVTAGLADLVLPGTCAGCGEASTSPQGVCQGCVAVLAALHPHPTRPDPEPADLPYCAALGDYHGVLRELILAYKEQGRHALARPLGRLLASVVASLLPADAAGRLATAGVVLVPVPDTPAAARARHGDHLWRLARPAAARLREAGVPVRLARPLRARPRPDSAGLDRAARAAAARTSLWPRPRRAASLRRMLATRPAPVVLLDDVVTTGATLAAAAARLATAGIPVTGAAVLAATRRRMG